MNDPIRMVCVCISEIVMIKRVADINNKLYIYLLCEIDFVGRVVVIGYVCICIMYYSEEGAVREPVGGERRG